MEDDKLPLTLEPIAVRLAHEGIPIAAIARAMFRSTAAVREAVASAKDNGTLSEIPPHDWPPSARRHDRLPCTTRGTLSDEDLMNVTMRLFTITRLQACILITLLRRDTPTKQTLHNAIESRRVGNMRKPHNLKETDMKLVEVVICHLRKRLKKHRVAIKTSWSNGYYIEPEHKAKVIKQIEDANYGLSTPN